MANQEDLCCQICCEDFNKTNRASIKCGFNDCNFVACKSCIRKYLLEITDDPHCMNCKKVWTQNFLVMNLNRSFVGQEYKNHRKRLLLEKEMSKMPGTMDAANRVKEIDIENGYIYKIDCGIDQLQNQINILTAAKRKHLIKISQLSNKNAISSQDKKQFIMPCPSNDCRGFLSTQYKCELCKKHTCPKCHVIIGDSKNDPHVCDENMVKSAELIKKDTKPCPSCGTRIYKISGCNQMWCTSCHVAFSWTSGMIETGIVHNPHFYEYQNSVNNGNVIRNPGDVVCGGLCHYHHLRQRMTNKLLKNPNMQIYFDTPSDNCDMSFEERLKETVRLIYSLHRLAGHIGMDTLPEFRQQSRDGDIGEPARIDYILNKRSKDSLSAYVYQKDYRRKKSNEILHIFELLNVTLIDMFARILNTDKTELEFFEELTSIINEFTNLQKYCNGQLEIISVSYNQSVPIVVYISQGDLAVRNHKYDGYSKMKRALKNSSTEEKIDNRGAAEES
jgi:hypothetical protein